MRLATSAESKGLSDFAVERREALLASPSFRPAVAGLRRDKRDHGAAERKLQVRKSGSLV